MSTAHTHLVPTGAPTTTHPWHPLDRAMVYSPTGTQVGRGSRVVRGIAGVAGGFLLGLVLGCAQGGPSVEGPSGGAFTKAPSVGVLAPCQTEDSIGPCFWDASSMGNGRGRSFIVGPDGSVTYLG